MWRWLADVLHRPDPDREARLSRLESVAASEVERAQRALAERQNLSAAIRNTSQALQRRHG